MTQQDFKQDEQTGFDEQRQALLEAIPNLNAGEIERLYKFLRDLESNAHRLATYDPAKDPMLGFIEDGPSDFSTRDEEILYGDPAKKDGLV